MPLWAWLVAAASGALLGYFVLRTPEGSTAAEGVSEEAHAAAQRLGGFVPSVVSPLNAPGATSTTTTTGATPIGAFGFHLPHEAKPPLSMPTPTGPKPSSSYMVPGSRPAIVAA